MSQRIVAGPLLVLMLISAVDSANAQQRRQMDREAALESAVEEMTERLELSEEQATEVRAIMVEQQTRSRELLEEARASGQGRSAIGAMRERMQEISSEADERIRGLLTGEQAAEFERMLAERAERRARGGGDRP